ncbi:tRNA (adenosine(37)-N6)-threonylcarbamoyltransferase complex ATPase subunit type 1 TsaE [Enemella sp. A6]|uniref:tRNA (adenosine(37)-N6)-threonylcarbamoyltransferase complex ATPase subunit type 1 TsaE n=1 Tax=Enemella sp. A6 TaxID=3440152 RepID=UPI003EBBF2B1
MPEPELEVVEAELGDAEVMVALMQAAFGARRPVDPPSDALAETADSVREALTAGTGVLLRLDGTPAATLLIDSTTAAEGGQPAAEGTVVLRRVSVHPAHQGGGVALQLIAAAEEIAAEDGARRVEVVARNEFPELIEWWQDGGYRILRSAPHGVVLGRELPVLVEAATVDEMHRLGERLASVLRAGDLIIASGDLGAGKTTLTQGLARGLDVDGPVISPTFVLSRVHHARHGGPDLVHVDAYRLESPEEFDDLDLDESYASAVTLVEWGLGLADHVSPDWLHIHIRRDENDTRQVSLRPQGSRWHGVDLRAVVEGVPVV